MQRSPTRLSLALLVGAMATGVLPLAASAQAPAVAPIVVHLTASGATGPSGLAVLTAADAATAVQVLAQNAPAGTTATIHTGTCDAVGADLVGLIGELGTTGQAQATVPVGLRQLADGAHVIVLHAGLDLTTNLACGLIPLTDLGALIPPLASPGALFPSAAPPAVVAGCEGVTGWLAQTQARLDRLKVLQDAANTAAAGTDLQAYLGTVATNVGELQVLVGQMQGEAVPAAAAAIQQELIQGLQAGIDGGTQLIEAFSGSSNLQLYQQSVAKSQEANQHVLKAKTMLGELQAKCPATPA